MVPERPKWLWLAPVLCQRSALLQRWQLLPTVPDCNGTPQRDRWNYPICKPSYLIKSQQITWIQKKEKTYLCIFTVKMIDIVAMALGQNSKDDKLYFFFNFYLPSRKSNNHHAEVTQCFLQSPICVLCSLEDSQPIRSKVPGIQDYFQVAQTSWMFMIFHSFHCPCHPTLPFCVFVSPLFIPLGSLVLFPWLFFTSNLLWHLQLRCELRAFSIVHQHFPFSRCTRLKEARAARSHLCENKKHIFPKTFQKQIIKLDSNGVRSEFVVHRKFISKMSVSPSVWHGLVQSDILDDHW